MTEITITPKIMPTVGNTLTTAAINAPTAMTPIIAQANPIIILKSSKINLIAEIIKTYSHLSSEL